MPHNFASVLQDVAKAPRDQLDRCAFLMKLCMEAKKAANSAEDGTKPATMTAADVFVDQACSYVTRLAVTATDVTDVRATARDEEWDSMKAATAQILNLLPSDVSALMKVELREAEVNSKKVGTKMKEINQVVGKGSKRAIIKLYFVCGRDGGLIGEDYEIQRCTPPSGLATIVLYRKKEGFLPTFYWTRSSPFVTTPAHWGPKEPTPAELYVVMDRGRLDFRFKIGLYSPITEIWVFRNLFRLHKLQYLKDSGGELHEAPNANLAFDRVVHCTKIRRSDQKRIAGPYPCSRWGEALKYIGDANDDDWIVEPERNHEPQRSPSSPSYTTSPILVASPISAILNTTSPTHSIHSAPPTLPVAPAPARTASLPLPPRAKAPPRLLTTASVITATIPPTGPPTHSPSLLPSALRGAPTVLPVIIKGVGPAIATAVLPVAPPTASATHLAVPSPPAVHPAITSTIPPATVSTSKQPRGGILSRAAKWTKKTLGL